MFKPEQIALDIAKSLKKHPEQWTTDGKYYLRHESGINIWIANETYGIQVNGMKPSFYSRRHIVKAYQCWLSWYLLTNKTHSKDATP